MHTFRRTGVYGRRIPDPHYSGTPFSLGLEASMQVHPVMSPEDLGRAAPAIDQAA